MEVDDAENQMIINKPFFYIKADNMQPLNVATLKPLNVGALPGPARAGSGTWGWSFPSPGSRARPGLAPGDGGGECRGVSG